jgi:uncharacterized protein (TIGR01777 family)
VRIIVTGGTGFVGQALCHELSERGDQVVILTRGQPRSRASGEDAARTPEFASWTPEARGPWMKLLDGADAVVHLAGASVADERWTEERKKLLWSSRVESTCLLAEAIAEAKKTPAVFVSASAVGLYGTSAGDTVLTESSPAGSDFLARLCVAWEGAAAPSAAAGVRVVHPRIGLVLGRGGGVYQKLAPLFRAFVGGPLGPGKQYMPWVHVRDVVRALVAMITRDDLSGAYNVTAPEPVTMNAFAHAMGESLGRPSLFRVPPLAMKLALGSEAATEVLTGQRAVPQRLIEAGFEFVFPDLPSALADLARERGARCCA